MGEPARSLNQRAEESSSRYLRFTLSTESYGMPLLSVKEVIAATAVTPLPQMPPYFLGIMNLRGQVVSVLDLRLKMGIKAVRSPENAVIICDIGSEPVGILVDSICSVLEAEASEISDPPDASTSAQSRLLLGVYRDENQLTLLLNIAEVLASDVKLAASGGKKI
jgi:purine-binding chemotaxis protein CheW